MCLFVHGFHTNVCLFLCCVLPVGDDFHVTVPALSVRGEELALRINFNATGYDASNGHFEY